MHGAPDAVISRETVKLVISAVKALKVEAVNGVDESLPQVQ